MTTEQKQAQSLAKKEVYAAGLKDSQLIKVAIDAAANLTPEQERQMYDLAVEKKLLYHRYAEAVKKVLAE